MMQSKALEEMHPWYKGFTGTIEPKEKVGNHVSKYLVKVPYEVDGNELRVTDLPIGKWTRDYKNFLEKLD